MKIPIILLICFLIPVHSVCGEWEKDLIEEIRGQVKNNLFHTEIRSNIDNKIKTDKNRLNVPNKKETETETPSNEKMIAETTRVQFSIEHDPLTEKQKKLQDSIRIRMENLYQQKNHQSKKNEEKINITSPDKKNSKKRKEPSFTPEKSLRKRQKPNGYQEYKDTQ